MKEYFVDPKQGAENCNQTGCFCMMIEQYEQALDMFQQAILYDPTHIAAWLNAEKACASLGRTEEAEQYRNVALRIDEFMPGGKLIAVPARSSFDTEFPEEMKQKLLDYYKMNMGEECESEEA